RVHASALSASPIELSAPTWLADGVRGHDLNLLASKGANQCLAPSLRTERDSSCCGSLPHLVQSLAGPFAIVRELLQDLLRQVCGEVERKSTQRSLSFGESSGVARGTHGRNRAAQARAEGGDHLLQEFGIGIHGQRRSCGWPPCKPHWQSDRSRLDLGERVCNGLRE